MIPSDYIGTEVRDRQRGTNMPKSMKEIEGWKGKILATHPTKRTKEEPTKSMPCSWEGMD